MPFRLYHFDHIQQLLNMKITHERMPCLINQQYYPDIVSRPCIHLISFLCWFLMILIGATLIGLGASNSILTYNFCADSLTFCTQTLKVQESTQLFFYVKLTSFNQYNRGFMDSYSLEQMHGKVGNTKYCEGYSTYSNLGRTTSAGGYRVSPSASAHPCGQVMVPLKVDIVFLVDSFGGTPTLDSGNLISDFNKNYHFLRLSQHQLSQWIDIQSQQFVNYFTMAFTGVKYQLVGRTQVSTGTYQIVMQNNMLTKGQFKKELVVSQVGIMGMTNHILGFTLFGYGVFLLFWHVFICFRWRK